MEYRIRHKKASFSVQKNVSSHLKTVLCIQTFTHHSFYHLLLGNLHPGIRSNALNATTGASVDSTRARATSVITSSHSLTIDYFHLQFNVFYIQYVHNRNQYGNYRNQYGNYRNQYDFFIVINTFKIVLITILSRIDYKTRKPRNADYTFQSY